MSTSPDLSLPAKAPTESYQKENHDGDKFAVYTLVDLGKTNNNGIHDLLKVLGNNNDFLSGLCYLQPKYDFSGGAALRDVYDYHLLELGRNGVHPTLFIVAQYPDYVKNGVLLVNLDMDLECSVDTCRVEASEAVLAVVNLQIANTGWDDYKDDELPLPPPPLPTNTASERDEA